MNPITAFQFQESQQVRVVADEHGNPWFCAKDVCDVLDYTNTSNTIADHCKEGGISKRYTPSPSGEQEMLFLSEGNLYRLIIKSNKPQAERFEAWVCDEVLPSIRKAGGYGNGVLIAETVELRNQIKELIRDKLALTADLQKLGNKRKEIKRAINQRLFKLGESLKGKLAVDLENLRQNESLTVASVENWFPDWWPREESTPVHNMGD